MPAGRASQRGGRNSDRSDAREAENSRRASGLQTTQDDRGASLWPNQGSPRLQTVFLPRPAENPSRMDLDLSDPQPAQAIPKPNLARQRNQNESCEKTRLFWPKSRSLPSSSVRLGSTFHQNPD